MLSGKLLWVQVAIATPRQRDLYHSNVKFFNEGLPTT